MKPIKPCLSSFALLAAGILAGCGTTANNSPDVRDALRTSLDRANLKDVSVSTDRGKGVVTLGGHVASENDRSQAEAIAKSMAGGQVVANEIGVIPPGIESDAKKINSALDQGIDKNLDAALLQKGLRKGISFDIKNAVVTLTGETASQAERALVQKVASEVPNVRQVVNELQVKNQKATSSN